MPAPHPMGCYWVTRKKWKKLYDLIKEDGMLHNNEVKVFNVFKISQKLWLVKLTKLMSYITLKCLKFSKVETLRELVLKMSGKIFIL